MSEKRLDFVQCNWDKDYYQIVIKGEGYFRRLSPNLLIKWLQEHNELLEELDE